MNFSTDNKTELYNTLRRYCAKHYFCNDCKIDLYNPNHICGCGYSYAPTNPSCLVPYSEALKNFGIIAGELRDLINKRQEVLTGESIIKNGHMNLNMRSCGDKDIIEELPNFDADI